MWYHVCIYILYIYISYVSYNVIVHRYIVTICFQFPTDHFYRVYVDNIYIYISNTILICIILEVLFFIRNLCLWLPVVSSGRWSSLSSFLQTPAAPPHSPVNTGRAHHQGLGQPFIKVAFVTWLGQNHMGVNPKIGVFTPKSSILIRFGTIINHPFWGFYPYFWKHPYSNPGSQTCGIMTDESCILTKQSHGME